VKAVLAAIVALSVVSAKAEFIVADSFFEAVRFVESTDGRYFGDQDGGRSHGPYQISLAYLQDANEYLGTNYTLRQVIDDESVAREVMVGYWNRYLPKDREVTYEILARIHNGGPKGYEKESTVPYWEKVEAKMKELEYEDQD
jgi:hypothetical protein